MGSLKARSTLQNINFAEFRVDPDLWGEGAEPRVLGWLKEHYNPRTMPMLQAAEAKGREGVWLLGWDHANTAWPPLMELIFGRAYSDKRLALNERAISLGKWMDEHGKAEYGMPTDRKEQ